METPARRVAHSSCTLRRIRLLELKRRNAHRAGTLIFNLCTSIPNPSSPTPCALSPQAIRRVACPSVRLGMEELLTSLRCHQSAASVLVPWTPLPPPTPARFHVPLTLMALHQPQCKTIKTHLPRLLPILPGLQSNPQVKPALVPHTPGQHPKKPGTPEGSSPSQTSDPHSSGTVPQSVRSGDPNSIAVLASSGEYFPSNHVDRPRFAIDESRVDTRSAKPDTVNAYMHPLATD